MYFQCVDIHQFQPLYLDRYLATSHLMKYSSIAIILFCPISSLLFLYPLLQIFTLEQLFNFKTFPFVRIAQSGSNLPFAYKVINYKFSQDCGTTLQPPSPTHDA